MSTVTADAELSRQRSGSGNASQVFAGLAEPLRQELKLHCYRMVGSVHEAEDLVQDTFLRAWRNFDSFEHRASIRAWLYRIATNACLDALASRKNAQRLLPDQQVPPAIQLPEAPHPELAWLEPYPDSELEAIADDAPTPEGHYASREAVQLAFVAAIQQLPPRQRVALLLSDVMEWSAGESAPLFGGSVASFNSALQRARVTLAKRYRRGQPPVSPRPDPAQQKLLGSYLRAWEGHDLNAFVALLKEDARCSMPPWQEWYEGREAIRGFFDWAWENCGGLRLVPTAANGQPAFAVYSRPAADAPCAAHSIHVLTLEKDMIGTLTLFVEPRLFPALTLPETVSNETGQ